MILRIAAPIPVVSSAHRPPAHAPRGAAHYACLMVYTNPARRRAPHCLLALAMALSMSACMAPGSGAFLSNGNRAYEATKWREAIDQYEKYLELRPGDTQTRLALGKAYLNIGDHASAASNLRIVRSQLPSSEDAVNALAEALFLGEKHDELYRLLRTEAVDEQTTTAWMRLGRYAMRLGDKDTAQQAYLAAAKLDAGRNVEPQLALYDYYRAMGDKNRGIERLRMAAYINPNSSAFQSRAKESGAILGPTFPLRPAEMPPPPPPPAPNIGP